MSVEGFIDRAKKIVGPDWVLIRPEELVVYERDYWPLLLAREYLGRVDSLAKPSAIVLPGSEAEVEDLVEVAREEGVRLVVVAGGTGVLGGAAPRGSGYVALDVSRLNWIKWFDEEAGVVESGAGTLLIELEEWLTERGWSLRHVPQSMHSAMIGGLVATRSIGHYSTGYGGIENRVKGIRAVVPRLGLIEVPPAPRRSLLYDLIGLLTGSEGTLGVITAVYLEALRKPEYEERIAALFTDFREALRTARILVQERIVPEFLRAVDEVESSATLGVEGALLLGILEGPRRLVEARLELLEEVLRDAKLLDARRLVGKWLEERFNVVKWVASLLKSGLGFDTIEVSATWSSVEKVYESARESLLSVDGVVYVGVHAGHFYPSGAALYFTIVFSLEELERIYYELWEKVLKATRSSGGSIGHHHGVGVHRARWLSLEYGEKGVKLLKTIKECIDPDRVLASSI